MSLRSKIRRSRRPKRTSVHSGQGHGERVYRPVRQTNWMAGEDARERRRATLAARDERTEAYLATLRHRAAEIQADPEREAIREQRRLRGRAVGREALRRDRIRERKIISSRRREARKVKRESVA